PRRDRSRTRQGFQASFEARPQWPSGWSWPPPAIAWQYPVANPTAEAEAWARRRPAARQAAHPWEWPSPAEVRQSARGSSRPGEALFGRAEVAIAEHVEPLEHVLHLLLCFGIGDLEIAQIVKQATEFLLQPFFAVAHPAADLALDEPRVVQIVALGAGKT